MKPRARALLIALVVAASGIASSTYAQFSKNSIVFPDDPFAVQSTNDQPGWIKFTILTADPTTVYFQDSNTYPFHYDFAVSHLPPFNGMSPAEFDQATLYEQGQLAILGAVILPPLVGFQHVYQEYGIQLVRQDPYDALDVVDLFSLVVANVASDPQAQALYFPTFEQQESAEQNEAFLAGQGIELSSTARWAKGNGCYSVGWALGELKYFASGQIDTAFLNGDLLPGDILLTDGVPAEIPFVAGVISLSPSTPASHVAILAETFNVPFTYLAVADDAQRAQDLVGNTIVLRVEDYPFLGCRVRLIDVENQLDAATIDQILALKIPPPLDIDPLQPYGAFSTSTEGLTPADIQYFGGKAANYGLLRQAIPDNSPVATAFSFDLWSAFMDQQMPGGDTLRETIAQMLAGYTYPPSVQALDATLDDIRDLIKDDGETSFPPLAEAAVLATLQDPQYGFDPNLKLRHRSSTNVEDGDKFSGAGLYDSFSGCLADDLDGNNSGPSHCDPEQNNERGVLRAIRKVFASFYNLNAFVERLRHGVDEDDVGMALLVHHSFPDEIELANGVALYEPQTYGVDTYLVSQTGASSVTNPDPGTVPEEAQVSTTGAVSVIAYSNLLPLGDTVMDFPLDYQQLRSLVVAAAAAWEQATGVSADYKLEFEYKKVAPDGDLVLKQIRRVPQADDTPSITPFLINEPTDYCLFQGEYGDVFGNHRLKSRWTIETLNTWLTLQAVQQSLYADVSLEYQEVCQLYQQSGPPSQWPDATYDYAAGTATDGWRFPGLQNPRTYEMKISEVRTLVAPSESPVLVITDFASFPGGLADGCFTLEVDYDRPVPTVDFQGPKMTTTDYGLICTCPQAEVGELLQQRSLVGPGGITIDTSFYWPTPPEGFTAGYTAPLVRWVGTTISGLTSTPISLVDDFSQTYRPEHHNFGENFIFEPALEPGIPQQQLDELSAAGIRAIHVLGDIFGGDPQITYYDDAAWTDACLSCTGFDGDKDGFCTGAPTFDCDDTRSDIWATPGEVPDLVLENASALSWSAPPEPGGDAPVYDTLRSSDPSDFQIGAACVEPDDGTDLTATDTDEPATGAVFHYLVRAENDCPNGEGTLGQDSDGIERLGIACP